MLVKASLHTFEFQRFSIYTKHAAIVQQCN
jgi:hypothetical protein